MVTKCNSLHNVTVGTPTNSELRLLRVRPILPDEEADWDRLMRNHHYLGFKTLVGKSLKYAALCDDKCIALLGWSTAAFMCHVRDEWIGWSREQQWKRLKFIANNSRFLILPGVQVKNLASKVLSLNLERLSDDWKSVHGHRLVLAETFVDKSRFSGTCYLAANWLNLGETRGFGRNGGQYYYHGNPKMMLVRPLHRNAKRLLTAPFISHQLEGESSVLDLNKADIGGKGGLIGRLEEVTDPRDPRGVRHNQASILAIAVCAVLAGSRGYTAIFEWAADLSQELLERFRCRWSKKKGMYIPPSEPTIRRALKSIDPDELDQITCRWVADHSTSNAIALDGKTLRGSKHKDSPPVHLLGSLSHGEGVVVSQVQVGDKTNEIRAFKPALEPLELEGKIVTADAMHTQVEHARYLVDEKGADYVFIVKGNQKNLFEDIEDLEDSELGPVHTDHDKGHGRIETREIRTSTALNEYINFPHVGQVFRLERSTTDLDGSNARHETAYGITSLSPESAAPADVLSLVRRHWEIETRLHWVRDVTFDEDRCQIRKGAGPRVFATLRNLAISLLRLAGCSNIAKALRTHSRNAERCLITAGI